VSRASRVSRSDLPRDLKVSKAKRRRSYLGLKILGAVLAVALVGAVVMALAFPELLPFKLPFRLPSIGAVADIPEPPPDKPEVDPNAITVPPKPEPPKPEPVKPEPVKPEPVRVDATPKLVPLKPAETKKPTPTPAPTPKLIDGKVPRPREAPTQAQLLDRIGKSLKPLEAMAILDGEIKDPIKVNLLTDLKKRASKQSTTAEERASIEKDLEDWEAQYRR
jgi:outer membrane biosynthesis protein TonB